MTDAAADDRAAVVALLRLGARPEPGWAERLEAGADPLILLDEALAHPGNQASLLTADPAPLLERARTDIVQWSRRGYDLLTVLDAGYPANLRQVHDRPALIFVRGRLRECDERSVAVIGSRRASPAAIRRAHEIAEGLVAAGFAVVSGMAAGVDTAAHERALGAGGRTIAVIGTGLDHCYPPQNRALQRRIAAEGAVVSQFWPEAAASRDSFPLRNAVMSGLSLATVVVEAGMRSGARVQCRRALAHGRPVLLGQPVLVEPWARELAGRPGVYVVEGPDEVVETVERLASVRSLTE